MDGKGLLAAFLARDQRSQAQFARDVGCSEGHLSLVLKGERGLSVRLAKRISEATDGAVPVRALVPDKLERAAEVLEAAQ
jgi:transcriptional regulator with XRE-family HTH domain